MRQPAAWEREGHRLPAPKRQRRVNLAGQLEGGAEREDGTDQNRRSEPPRSPALVRRGKSDEREQERRIAERDRRVHGVVGKASEPVGSPAVCPLEDPAERAWEEKFDDIGVEGLRGRDALPLRGAVVAARLGVNRRHPEREPDHQGGRGTGEQRRPPSTQRLRA